MDQYHESQTAGKCIATSSPAKHDMSQALLYHINDYDVEQNYEKKLSCICAATVLDPQATQTPRYIRSAKV